MAFLRLLGPGPWRALLRRRRKKNKAKARRARKTAAPPRLPPMMGPRLSEEPEATGMVPGAEVEPEALEVVLEVLEAGWLVDEEVVEDVVEDSVEDDVEEDLRVVVD